MKVADIPMEKIRTGFAYLKSGRTAARVSAAGIEDPATVIEANGFFEVVDGFKRLNSLKKTGATTVPAVIQNWEPVKAKAMMLSLNARRNTLSFYEEAAIAADLCRKEGMKPSAAARLLGRKESWVSKRVAIFTRLDPAIVEFLKKGDIGPTLAYHLSRIPSCLQMPLFLSARQEDLTAAEVEAAASLALSVPEAEARKIVRDPRKYFSPPAPAASEPVPPGISGELASVISSLDDAARAVRRAREKACAAPKEMTGTEERVFRSAIRRASHEAELMLQALGTIETEERSFRHAGQGIHGPARESDGRAEMLDSEHCPDPENPQGLREEAAGAFPGKDRARPAAGSVDAGPVPRTDPGTGRIYEQGERKGCVPDGEEHLPHDPQGGIPGRENNPRRFCPGNPRDFEDAQGLRPVRAASGSRIADGLVAVQDPDRRQGGDDPRVLDDPVVQSIPVPGGLPRREAGHALPGAHRGVSLLPRNPEKSDLRQPVAGRER
jgi:ParB-like chromosome segregation protein Spo0J